MKKKEEIKDESKISRMRNLEHAGTIKIIQEMWKTGGSRKNELD